MKLLANNNANSVLAASVSNTATTMTVVNASTSNFPTPVAGESYFMLTLVDAATGMNREIVKVVSVSGNIFTVERAQENTQARSWVANDVVANLITAGTLLSFVQTGERDTVTVDILEMTSYPMVVRSSGFYTTGDGGDGQWIATGATNTARAGTHVVTEGKIYNKSGGEYKLNISTGKIDIRANGGKRYTIAQCMDQTTDDFMCAGEVVNGITSLLAPAVYMSNNTATYLGADRIEVFAPGGEYRVGKHYMRGVSSVTFNFEGCNFYVWAGKSYTYKVTGKRLDGFKYGVDEIEEKWEIIGRNAYWGSLSCQRMFINGGKWYGDHTSITKAADDCSTGVLLMVLNPEGVKVTGVEGRDGNWISVTMPAMLEETVYRKDYGLDFDSNTLDYEYVTAKIAASGATSRAGNFNRIEFDGCKFESGRRGVMRDACDWSALNNCEVINSKAWRQAANVSGYVPQYLLVTTGTVFSASGACYIGPAAAKDYNARDASVYCSPQKHSFDCIYNEWDYNFMRISRRAFIGAANRLAGLAVNMVSTYKDNFLDYNFISFEKECWPVVSDKGDAVYPSAFSHFDTPTGLTSFHCDAPTRDWGAFRHGGFDFKFGPYNTYLLSGTDWESWRSRPYAKAMFNANGLQLNSGTIFLPWQNPTPKSMVCIWYYDHTGNFDPRNGVAWQTAASQDGSNSDEALYKSFTEKTFDYGNGYKCVVLSQKRLTAFDGLYTFARNANIVITVPATTPITLKAVEAYTGGVPMFPNGCGNYEPESAATSVLSTVTNQVGYDCSMGGGLFAPGDMVAPWAHRRWTQSGYDITPTMTSGATITKRLVTGGLTLETAFKVAFNATVVSVDSTNALTTVSVPAAQLPYVAVGIPLYIVSGSSTGKTGQVKLLKRVMNADGTASANYLVIGVIGAAGDTLAIDQSQITAYTFNNSPAFDAVTASTMTVSGLATAAAFRATNDIGAGYNGASGVKSMNWYFNGGTTASHSMIATSTSGMRIEAAGNLSVVGNIFGSVDNTYSFGTASNRASQVYATNSTINTSNKDKKTGFRNLTDDEVSAFCEIGNELDFVWQWLDKYQTEGDDARLHSGPTVQDAIAVMEKYGLDWTRYSCFCYSKWDAQPEVIESWPNTYELVKGDPESLNEDGSILTPATEDTFILVREAGSRIVQEEIEAGEDYAFRKEELIFWIMRAFAIKRVEFESSVNGRLEKLEG